MLRMLLDRGADPNGCDLVNSLVLGGDFGLLKMVIEEYGGDFRRTSLDGATALHFAATMRYEAILEYLIKMGADVNRVDGRGNTPLHIVCIAHDQSENDVEQQIKTLAILLKHGADADLVNANGMSPLDLARRLKCDAKVIDLLKGGVENP